MDSHSHFDTQLNEIAVRFEEAFLAGKEPRIED
jgi:hypothetical protein